MNESPPIRKRLGRPPTGGPLKRPVHVMLDARVAEGLRRFGGGNLSAGVALAVEKARRDGAGTAVALPDVRAALAKGRKRLTKLKQKAAGRPVVGLAPRLRTTIQMYPALLEEVRAFGDGVVAQGIERVALLVRAARL